MQTAKLGTLVRIIGGGTPDRTNPEYWDGDIPWVTVKDVQSSRITSSQESITEKGLHNSASNLIPAGSIIVPTRMALGKVAINEVPIAINQDLKALTVQQDSIDRDYLHRFLLSKSSYLESRGKGATVKGITLDVLTELDVPIPSLPEQRRLATILDKADAIRLKRREAIKLADEFLRATFLDLFSDPITNPKSWDQRTLEKVIRPGTSITYGIVQAGPHVEDGIPYIRTGDFKNGELQLSGLGRTAPEIAIKFQRSRVETGDLVYCIRASIGSVDVVPPELDGANLTQGTARIACGDDINNEFLKWQLRTSQFGAWIDRHSKGATFKEITLETLRNAPVIVPPLALQHRFVTIAQTNHGLVQRQRLQLQAASDCFASLSHHTFQGIR